MQSNLAPAAHQMKSGGSGKGVSLPLAFPASLLPKTGSAFGVTRKTGRPPRLERAFENPAIRPL
jgi:hypothetical protein